MNRTLRVLVTLTALVATLVPNLPAAAADILKGQNEPPQDAGSRSSPAPYVRTWPANTSSCSILWRSSSGKNGFAMNASPAPSLDAQYS